MRWSPFFYVIWMCSWLPLFSGVQGQTPFVLQTPRVPGGVGVPQAAADFDGDGDVDILGSAGFLENDGSGSFLSRPGSFGLPTDRLRVVAADLDGDGLKDLAFVRTNGAFGIAINLGGSFSFQQRNPGVTLPGPLTTGFPRDLVALDVDGDGDQDLAVLTNAIPLGTTLGAAPALLVNQGGAVFAVSSHASFPLSNRQVLHLVPADLDGDGDEDLALSYYGATAMNVGWCRNVLGVFSAPMVIGTTPTAVLVDTLAAQDADGDGRDDLVWSYGGTLDVAFGGPTGPGVVVSNPGVAPGVLWELIPIDAGPNGHPELLAFPFGDSTQVLRGAVLPGGIMAPLVFDARGVGFDGQSPGRGCQGDFDLDGDLDQALSQDSEVAILSGDGVAGFVLEGGPHDLGFQPHIGDFDGDGFPDVLSPINRRVEVHLGDADGNLRRIPDLSLPVLPGNIQQVELSHGFDADGDGDVDLCMVEWGPTPGGYLGPAAVVLNLNQQGAGFARSFLGGFGDVSAIVSFDCDGDGDLDLALGRRGFGPTITGPTQLVRNLGGGLFAPPVAIGIAHATNELFAADFDGDGDQDLLQLNALTPGGIDPSELLVNNGAGTFTRIPLPTALSASFGAVGDTDGDGLPDLVATALSWRNTGGLAFVAGPLLPSQLQARAALRDVDGDGALDLVESPATVYKNLGSGVFAAPISILPRVPVQVTNQRTESAFADLDGDGDLEIAGSDGRLYLNATRQLTLSAEPRIGALNQLFVHGPSGAGYRLFASLGTSFQLLPPVGLLRLDLNTTVLVAQGNLPTTTTGLPAALPLSFLAPSAPSFIGVSLHWQMLDGQPLPRLSNHLVTTLRN